MTIDVAFSQSSLCEKYSEAAAFVARGIDPADACQIVGLPLRYRHTISPSETIKHLPTPAEIAEITAKMQLGEIVVSYESGRRWAENRKAWERK